MHNLTIDVRQQFGHLLDRTKNVWCDFKCQQRFTFHLIGKFTYYRKIGPTFPRIIK